MAHRINRVRNLVIANTDVGGEVPDADVATSNFPNGEKWPVPGVLIQEIGSPRDSQIDTQDLFFQVRCYGVSSTVAEALFQTVRTALTAFKEFGVRSPDDHTAHKAVLSPFGIYWISEEVGAQEVPEPNSGRRGTIVIMGTFRAEFKAT